MSVQQIVHESPRGKAVIVTGTPPQAVILSGVKNPRISLLSIRSIVCSVVLLIAALTPITGCHSAYINATVSNQTPAAISLVQVEYPSASFGTQTIASGQEFHYRFKILGSGQMKITYTDLAQAEHKATGPTLNEGTEGALKITVAPDGVHWDVPPAK